MAGAEEIRQLSIRRLSSLIADGALTCRAVSEAFCERIAEREDDLKAWAFFDAAAVDAHADDAALVAAVLATVEPAAWERQMTAAPRLGVYRGPKWELAEKPALDALERSIALMREAGADIVELTEPELLKQAYDAQVETLCFEMARTMAFEWRNHRDRISPLLQGWLERGWGVAPDRYLSGQSVIEAARRSMNSAFSGFDAWITLSAPGEAPRGLEQTGDTVFNRLWSLLHLPAITLPAGRGPNGLPLGVQFVGAFRNDARLISVARWAETVFSNGSSQDPNIPYSINRRA